MKADLKKLQDSIGYQFKNPAHLLMALTHRSAHANNNERYEFLGDAVLGMVIAKSLFDRFTGVREGKLTRMRAKLVRGETLAIIADEIDLRPYLILGEGELKAGGRQRSSIRVDALEAIFGAIYVDKGFDAVRIVILNLYETRLAEVNPNVKKDPKTLLQEVVQKRGIALPVYRIVMQTGQAHNLEFKVECRLSELNLVETADGKSRRRAEQAAASKLLESI